MPEEESYLICETEVRVKCNVCGHIYCYTEADIERNRQNYNNAKLSAISAIANVVGGTMVGAGSSSVSSADEIKKFKELLDSGVITQEEFDAKKKQLLGL